MSDDIKPTSGMSDAKKNGKGGRPSRFSSALMEKFFERLKAGRSVIEVCRDDDMPCESTIYDWLAKKPELSDEYVRACERREDYFVEEEIGLERSVLAGGLRHDNFDAVMKNRWRRRERLARKKYGRQIQLDANVNMSLAQALDGMEDEE